MNSNDHTKSNYNNAVYDYSYYSYNCWQQPSSVPETLPVSPAKPQLPVATSVQQEGSVWHVTFNPSIIQQAKVSTAGLLGDFIIRYDVQRDASVGDVQVRGQPPFGANSTRLRTFSSSSPLILPPSLLLAGPERILCPLLCSQ